MACRAATFGPDVDRAPSVIDACAVAARAVHFGATFVDDAHDLRRHIGGIGGGIDHLPARWFERGQLQVAAADTFVEPEIMGRRSLETSQLGRCASPAACQALLDGQVEQDGQVGSKPARREPLQLAQALEGQARSISLIGQRRIGVAVTHDHLSAFERGTDDLVHGLGSRGVEEKGVAFRTPVGLGRVQEQLADAFTEARPTGFAGERDPVPGVPKRLGEAGCLE